MASQQTDTLAVELVVDDAKATVKLDQFGQKAKLVNDDINRVGGDKQFAGKMIVDLDALTKRAEETRKSFEGISKIRLDAGQINSFTKEIVAAQEKSRQLSLDIVNLRRELANPNRKSSISFLTQELRGAEIEADKLARKLNTLPAPEGSSSASGGGGAAKIGRLRGFGSLIRSTGLGVGEMEINAGLSVAELAGIEAAGVATFGAIAAAGAVVVKVTQNIREEAERHLKVEEQIAGAINRQILGQKEALKNFQELRETNSFDRQFSRQVQSTSSIEELKAQRETLEKLYSLAPKSETGNKSIDDSINGAAERNKNHILALDAAIDALQQRNQKQASDSFSQRWDAWKKSQDDAVKSEERAAQKAKTASDKKKADLEKAEQKIKEIEKNSISAFDSLFAQTKKENPFVSIFGEGDKALRALRENLRGISPELKAVAESMQRKLNDTALFGARLDGNLNAFDLRDQAATFRNFAPKPDTEAQKKKFDQIIKSAVENSVVEKTFGGFFNNGRKVSDFTPEQQRDIFEKQILANAAPNNLDGTISYLARLRQSPKATDENLTFQERLQKQINIIDKAKSGATNQDEIDAASRRIIALTSVDPSKLNESERLRAAEEREREAVRIQNGERDARALHLQEIELQKQIAENGKRLVQIAERDGLKGLENVIRLVDDRSEGKSELKKAPTAADVQKTSDDAYTGGTFFNEYQK